MLPDLRSHLHDGGGRLQKSFSDFSKVWCNAGDAWRDDRHRQFEQQHLSTIGPSLQRFSSTLSQLSESVSRAQKELRDEDVIE